MVSGGLGLNVGHCSLVLLFTLYRTVLATVDSTVHHSTGQYWLQLTVQYSTVSQYSTGGLFGAVALVA